MTIAIFQAWLIDFNKYISKKKRNVILLVDNAGGHNLTEKWMNDNLTCVKVYYLPPNTTSVLQPCDAGIIRSFKAKYRKRVVKHLLLTIEMQDSYDLPDQKQAIIYIQESWKKVTKETIVNCWRHTKLLGDELDFESALKLLEDDKKKDDEELREEFNRFDLSRFEYKPIITAKKYIEIDKDIEVSESLNDKEIVDLVLENAQLESDTTDKTSNDSASVECVPLKLVTSTEVEHSYKLLFSYFEQ